MPFVSRGMMASVWPLPDHPTHFMNLGFPLSQFLLRAACLLLLAVHLPLPVHAQGSSQFPFASPAGTLSEALENFSRVTGYDVAARADRLKGKSAPALQGTYTAEAALARLLSGSGLDYRITGARTVAIVVPQEAPGADGATTMPAIVVTGDLPGAPMREYAGGQVALGGQVGLLGNRSVFDTPFTTTNYTATLIQNQQPRSVGDLLLNDPSVNTQWPRGSFVDRYQIRGFQVDTSSASLNGLYGIAQTLLTMPEAFERVELFKGPNALLNGKVGSVGGGLNYVTKRATAEPITQLTATYDSPGFFGGHVDLGRRFGKDGELGVRFNGVYRSGDTEGEHQSQELGLAALGVDYRLREFRVSADLIYQKQYQTAPRSQIYVEGPIPYLRPPDAHESFQQPWEFAGGSDLIGMLRAELDITEHVTVYGAIGGRQSTEKQSRDIPILRSGVFDANAGDFGAFPDYYRGWSEADSELVGLRAKFELGPTKHEFSISANRTHQRSGDAYTLLFDDTLYPQGLPDNIYHPATRSRPDFPYLPRKGPKYGDSTESSYAFADIISILDERVQAIVGVRSQRVVSRSYDQVSGAQTQTYDENKWTPAYTLLVKPLKQLSIYGSYIQALEQGPVAPQGTSNAGQIFPPTETEQYEVGAKVDLGRFGMTLAWFQITQPFAVSVANGTGLPLFVVDGEQRNRGVEFSMFGEPVKGVRLLGGVTYLDPILQQTEGGLHDGQKAPGNSDWVINVGAEWDTPFIPGLTVTGRVAYQTKQYLLTSAGDNALSIPAWTRLDLGLRYATTLYGRPTTFRATCENVADKNYWASASNGYLLAQPRTFLMSVTMDF